MTTSGNTQDDGFDFIRKMWGNMGFNLPGVMTPTLDTEELERRITDLKAVEGWLKMNLNVLQMTIQGLEVQRATLLAVKAMSATPQEEGAAPSSNPFANPALWTWPFATPTSTEQTATDKEAGLKKGDAPPPPEASPKSSRKASPKT